jgi:hypothetical protein
VIKDTWVPIMYVLMPDKLLESYTAVMQGLTTLLSDQGLALAAQWAMTDFEINIRKSIERAFPGVELKGCNFHFCQVGCLFIRHIFFI